MLFLMNGGLAAAQWLRRALCGDLFPPADGRRPASGAGFVLPRQSVHRARPCAARPPARLQAPVADRSRSPLSLSAADGALLRLCRPRRVDPGRGAGGALVFARDSAMSSPRGSGRSGRASASRAPARCFATATAMVAVQACWFVQSQADVFIAGRLLDPHRLGLYTTALFLTQILAAKFVPPLNEVAFAAYSRIQARRDVIQTAFLKSVRLIMLVALPFYFGLAATAEPFVLTFLGPKWIETAHAGAGARHGDAADDAADPVRARDQRARPAGPGGSHRPGRRGADAGRLPRRHPMGRRRASPGPGWAAWPCCSPPPSRCRGR